MQSLKTGSVLATDEQRRKGYGAPLNFKIHGPNFQSNSIREAAMQQGRMRAAAPMEQAGRITAHCSYLDNQVAAVIYSTTAAWQ